MMLFIVVVVVGVGGGAVAVADGVVSVVRCQRCLAGGRCPCQY